MKKLSYLLSLLIVFLFAGSVFGQEHVEASFSTNDTLGCIPFSVAFTNESVDALSYFWDFGDGNTSTLNSPVNTYLNSGSYTVKLVATCHTGEVDSIEFYNYIVVLDTPSVSFSYSSDTLCPSMDSIQFTNNTTAATSYLWDFDDGNISSLQNPQHIYQQQGSYTVSLIAYNVMGCDKSTTGDSPIIVYPKPTGTITSSLNHVCDTNNVVSFSTDAVAVDIYWDFDDGMYGSGQAPNHLFTNDGSYNVSALLVDENDCENTINHSQNITVTQALSPEITVSDSAGCPPLSVDFENLTPNVQTAIWTVEGNSLSGNNPSYTFTTSGIKNIQLSILDSNNCTTDVVFSDILSVNNVPSSSFLISDSIGCTPLYTSLINQGNSSFTYNWAFSDGQQFSDYSPSVLFNDAQFIDLAVTISDPMGCDAVEVFDNLIDVQSAAADISMNDYTGCLPLDVSFFDNSTNVTSWIWNFGDGTTSSEMNPIHLYDSAGVFSVQLTTYNSIGCVDTIQLVDAITVYAPQYNYNSPDTIESCNSVVSYFDGTSVGQISWLWDFGDGTTSTNSEEVHTYSFAGNYEVSLTTYDANGCQFTISDYANYNIAFGDIGFEYGMSCQANLFSFIDTSSFGTEWLWDFGDGTVDTAQSPIHEYDDFGIYLVQYTVIEGGCSQTINTMVSSAFCLDNETSAELIGEPMEVDNDTLIVNLETGSDSVNLYCVPYTINLSPPFDSLVSILWDFGDGETSTSLEVSHTYMIGGVFDLIMTIETIDSIYVYNSPEFLWLSSPVHDYSIDQSNICGAGANAKFFVDSLSGASYLWSFGDGTQSTVDIPVHYYEYSGNYLSSLEVITGSGCSSIIVKPLVVNTPNPLFTYPSIVCLNEESDFTSNVNNYANYIWDFGDGITETGDDVSHIYSAAGIYWVTLSVVDSVGCADTIDLPNPIEVNDPVADFAISDSVGCDNLDVSFTNLSQYSDSWLWIFGNGNTSADFEPDNLFDSLGVFDVTLVAFLGSCSDTLEMPIAVTVHESVIPAFNYVQQNSCYPVTLEFQNLTQSNVSLSWDFGDGNSDTISNPIHTFYLENATDITLSIVDSNQCQSSVTHVGEASYQSSFEINSLAGCVPVYASFSNLSDSAVSWLWNFGNGDTSVLTNPTYVFSDTGSYQVSLISTSTEGCTDTVLGSELITVDYLAVDFAVLDSASCAPMATSFMDLTGNALSWQWSFGDSSFSALQNPSHIYMEPGSYSVVLVAGRGSSCFDTIVKPDFLQVLGPQVSYTMSDTIGCDSLGVQFINQSIDYTQAEWFFGDGSYSLDSNSFHSYTDTGSFTGSLVVYDDNGCSDYIALHTINIHASPIPIATPSITYGCVPLTVDFDNQSLNSDSSNWDFDYGFNSSIESPSYTYNIVGTYYVALYTENKLGCSASLDSIRIDVNPSPDVDFETDINNHCFPTTLQFTNLTPDTSNISFLWNFYNGTVSQEVSPNVTFSNAGSYDILLIANNQYNCTSSLIKPSYINLNDTLPPSPNIVFTVSVEETGAVIVKWDKSTENDFHSYNVYRSNPLDSTFNIVDSLIARDNSTMLSSDVETQDYFYGFIVQPIDQCGNRTPIAELIEYRTILLSAESVGENTVQLNWTLYKGSEPEWYSIFREYNGIIEQIAQLSSTSSSYIDTSFKCNDQYSYVVIAEGLDRSIYFSQSNIVDVDVINELMLSQSIKIVRSTVVENEFVLTEWAQPTIYPETVTGYVLLRSTSADSDFETIQQLPAYITQYSDYDTEVMEQSYYYQVEIENVCSQKLSSNISSSILLNQQSDGNKVILSWSTYKGWSEGVEKYIIEKQINDNEWEVIQEVPGTQQQATDIIHE